MKITFEGEYFSDILKAMASVIADAKATKAPMPEAPKPGPTVNEPTDFIFEGPGPEAKPKVQGPKVIPEVINTGEIPEKSPTSPTVLKPGRTEKQRENDEKLRIAAKAKAAAKKAEREAAASTASMMPMPPPPKTAEGMDPAEVVNIRNKTITDLQEAYANGFQKEVFELLSRFGNGAKSFRELPPESFVPIREAIDNGALT